MAAPHETTAVLSPASGRFRARGRPGHLGSSRSFASCRDLGLEALRAVRRRLAFPLPSLLMV